MFEIKALASDPCQICRAMVLILLYISVTQIVQNFESIDFFGLRHQVGQVPLVVDLVGIVGFAFGLWVLCERVVVGKLLGGCVGTEEKNGQAGTPGTASTPP